MFYYEESEEEPFQSSGSEYIPSDTENNVENALEVTQNQTVEVEIPSEVPKTKGKKRSKNEDGWKKNIRKKKRTAGQSYVSVSGKVQPEKSFCPITCICQNKCHLKIIPERQSELFSNFYKLATFDLQSSYLFSQIKVVNKMRCYTNKINDEHSSKREKTRLYYLTMPSGTEVKVCKSFFKNVFKVSDGRLTRVVKNKNTGGTPPVDKRGKHNPPNKTNPEKVVEVKTFIEKFPSYESHYTRHKNPNRKFLSPHLSLNKMYELYKNEIPEPVSNWVFREIFNKEFNLLFHAPVSDSCKKCDILDMKIRSIEDLQIKSTLTTEKELHLRKAECARNGLKNDSLLAKSDDSVTTITFDLMQTLPTPALTTGICFYKRQLWTYCFGVHNMGTENVVMFTWNESVASRGPQEIGSCLLYYFKNYVRTKKVVMYSDQCGGQNRNIKLAVLCNFMVSNPEITVEEIDHKFLVSGHSYLPCDQDFGLIEKQKKYFQEIFLPQDWNKVIRSARKKNAPFEIVEMSTKDFVSTKQLEKNITNRKISLTGDKVEWLKFQWLQYRKSEPYVIRYKYSNNDSVDFSEVGISKRNTRNILSLETLYPNGHSITVPKKKDLMDLLPFIPPIYHDFYKNLKTSADAEDVLDISDNVQNVEEVDG